MSKQPAKKRQKGQGLLSFAGGTPSPAPAPSTDTDAKLHEYLSEKVYWGVVQLKDRWKETYAMCQGASGSAAKWDKKAKTMGTTDVSVLPRLMNSGLWNPLKIPPSMRDRLIELAGEKEAEESAKAEQRAEAKRQAALEEAERQALKDTSFTTAVEKARATVQAVTRRDEDEEDPRDLEDLLQLANLAAGYHACNAFDLEEFMELVEISKQNAELGPTGGITGSQRILRWLAICGDLNVVVEDGREKLEILVPICEHHALKALWDVLTLAKEKLQLQQSREANSR